MRAKNETKRLYSKMVETWGAGQRLRIYAAETGQTHQEILEGAVNAILKEKH